MLIIGIDVGGTFTDGVLFHDNSILSSAKRPTQYDNLQCSMLGVLDELLQTTEAGKIERVVLSTTLVTNVIATGQGERVALIMLPGHGLPHNEYQITEDTYFARGSIDFRGRELEAVNKNEIIDIVRTIKNKQIKQIAVAGKFSNRNNKHEKLIREIITVNYVDSQVFLSSEISTQLNYPRRAVSAYYTAMTWNNWNVFVDSIKYALQQRNINAEVEILKADGGTIPLQHSRNYPCETVFSGPAASTMGGAALTMDDKNSVVVDIGGTTTDISLIIDGKPLYASRGAVIEGKYTHINSFAVHSVPIGGDTTIYLKDGQLVVGKTRNGPAVCFGGQLPAVTDAFNVYFKLGLGNYDLSQKALQELAEQSGSSADEISSIVVETVITRIAESIKYMFTRWENEPAYKVWEVVNNRKFELHRIIGIGAAADTIIPHLAAHMKVAYLVNEYSPVANALGAAVVRPTIAVNMHIDTQQNMYIAEPGGESGVLKQPGSCQLDNARELALAHLLKVCKEREMLAYSDDYTFYMEEQFNIVRGWERAGKIFDIGVQISPGFITGYKGVRRL